MVEGAKSPQQSIFDEVFKRSINLGFSTYDYLPAEGTSYPFVYVGAQINSDRRTKRHIYGEVNQDIHIYAIQRNGEQPQGTNRSAFTGMMDQIKTEMRKIKRVEHFYAREEGINDQILTDTSTSTTLLHGVIEVRFLFH